MMRFVRIENSIMPKYIGTYKTIAPSYVRVWFYLLGWRQFTVILPKFGRF